MDNNSWNRRLRNFCTSDRCATELIQAYVTRPKALLVEAIREYYEAIHPYDKLPLEVYDAYADELVADWYFENAYHCFDC